MNTELFIAKRIISGGFKTRLSAPVVRISIGAITIGIMAMILTIAIVVGFQKEVRQKVVGFGADIVINNYDSNTSYEPVPIDKDQSFLKELQNNKEIKHIQVFATKNGLLKTKTDNEGIVLKGVGSDYDWSFFKKNLVAGDIFSVSDTGTTKQALISKTLSMRLKLKTGDKVLVFFVTKGKEDENGNSQYEQRVKEFYVSGIYNTGLDEFDKRTVIVDIAQIQKLNYWDKNQVAGYEIAIKDFSKLDKMGEYVYDLTGTGVNAQTIRQTNPAIFSWLKLVDNNAVIVIVLMVVVAAINMISALLILILERTTTIGILKALGANNGSIQKVFLYNAAYLIGKGLLWGNIIGLALCLIQKQFGLITLPQETYYVSVVPINIDLISILLLNVGTLVVCMLMLLGPSLLVSKITPVKAIRFE